MLRAGLEARLIVWRVALTAVERRLKTVHNFNSYGI